MHGPCGKEPYDGTSELASIDPTEHSTFRNGKQHINPNTLKPFSKNRSIGEVLNRPMEDVKKRYIMQKELGRGQFGITYRCTDKKTGEHFACKSVLKAKLTTKEERDDVRREVEIMYHLAGNPNIVELKGAYEDEQSVHFVMELCEGGELFDRIIQKGMYSEREAAALCRTIMGVVRTCHSHGVIHRDLKPENFLFLDKREDSPLKAIDFGLSVFYQPGDVFKDTVGSAYYVAPEVLHQHYGPAADVWSVGVILYILLSGVPPFWAETEEGIFKAILKGKVDLKNNPWPSISSEAKDLIKKILVQDPRKRLTPTAVLNHRWVREDGTAPDNPLDPFVLSRMKQFRAMNKLKKLALKVIAGNLSEEEISGLKKVFTSMDTNKDEKLSYEELKMGLAKQGAMLAETEVQQLLDAADVDGNGTIDYKEFISATMHLSKLNKEEYLDDAFKFFDKNNDGFITVTELKEALSHHNMGDEKTIEDIIDEVDTNKDGQISLEEFKHMMKKGMPVPTRKR
ncbi:hypothetical protein KP509_05G065600 [Ceratopteris richardii]|nr:hypothetical protein KP509_05G065600 [Ceratopteris richardii]KAH7437314.1 hypothetical protein KP509_05G065600 [Ceratopteris richardii]